MEVEGPVDENAEGTKPGEGEEGDAGLESGDGLCIVDDEEELEDESQDEDMADTDGHSAEGHELRANAQSKTSKKGKAVVRGVKTGMQSAKVHCAKKAAYWCGMIQLIENYWLGLWLSVWFVWAGKWQYAVCTAMSNEFETWN